MAPTGAPRGHNQLQTTERRPAGGLAPLRLEKGLRSTSPPAPEEVRDAKVKRRGLTNPYMAKRLPAGRTHADRAVFPRTAGLMPWQGGHRSPGGEPGLERWDRWEG